MLKLRINPLVVKDLKSIHDYISEDNEDMARKIIAEIYDCFEKLQQFPAMGAELSKRVSYKTDYKYLVHDVYIIIYRIHYDYIEIYRVIDRYQDFIEILFH
ncbi:MAG: type II toxin-antitoxin system RelE/ParE family toxin [Clostridia bacterium]|nr:type II toxin-antitoxin system RelE/ParE family toxin [Lachnospiraceae bacterium]NCC01743.1 type II toxin-antitoxin system RelE/ParE family toxin [Clostridia bacterium]NCD03664.1 type II toxin-antitoxin system RelE/ParE family toxin [Clostridia bacterium]